MTRVYSPARLIRTSHSLCRSSEAWGGNSRTPVCVRNVVEGKGRGPQRPLDAHPAGSRVPPVEMRRRTAKALAAVLFLTQTFGNSDMGLVRWIALFHEIHRRPPLFQS